MAESGGRERDSLRSNVILQDIDGRISHILFGLSNIPKGDIIEQLKDEIEYEEIQQCRDYLYKAGVGVYDEQLEEHGLAGKAKLELKQRRGDSAHEKCCSDIVELVQYVCGHTLYFPREMLSSRSTYVDIVAPDPESGNVNRDAEDNGQTDMNTMLRNLQNKCDNYERAISKMWEYIFNIEKVWGDKISAITKTHSEKGMSGSKCSRERNTVSSTSTSAQHVDAAVHASEPRQTITANGQGSGNAQPTADHVTVDDIGVEEDDISLNSLLATDPLRNSQMNLKPNSQTVKLNHNIGDDSDIACGQRHRDDVRMGSDHEDQQVSQLHNGLQLEVAQTQTSPHTNGNPASNTEHAGQTGIPVVERHSTPRSSQQAPPADSNSGPSSRPSFCDVINTDAPWSTQAPRRRQRDDQVGRNNNNTNQMNTSLTGQKIVKSAELYVQNIAKYEKDSLKDIADRVRRYCRNKGVRVVNARVISNKYCDDVVGCKISVPINQVDTVLGNHIWPDDVTCRRWRKDRNQPSNSNASNDRQVGEDTRGNNRPEQQRSAHSDEVNTRRDRGRPYPRDGPRATAASRSASSRRYGQQNHDDRPRAEDHRLNDNGHRRAHSDDYYTADDYQNYDRNYDTYRDYEDGGYGENDRDWYGVDHERRYGNV